MIIVKVQIGDRGEILRSLPGRRDVIEIAIIVIVTRSLRRGSGGLVSVTFFVSLPSDDAMTSSAYNGEENATASTTSNIRLARIAWSVPFIMWFHSSDD